MSLPKKYINNDIQHYLHSSSTQSLTSLLPDRHSASEHDIESSHNWDTSLDQHQRDRDLERQSIASYPRSSSSSPSYQHAHDKSDEKHKKSAQIQIQALQDSFDDLDRFQQQQKQIGSDVASSPFSNYSTTHHRTPLTPSPASSHLIRSSDISHSIDHLLSDVDEGFSSLAPPYAECPLVTDDLHVPVPAIIHQFFIYDDNNIVGFGNKEHLTNSNDKTFDTLVDQLCPYPFRSRAPLNDRLKRKPQNDDMDTAKRYPSILAQQREKRHSLGNGQIDRLVHGRKGLLEDHELLDLLYDPREQHSPPRPSSSSSSSSSSPSSAPSPSPPPQHHHRGHEHLNDDLLLEDRIHWLTQGYYFPTLQTHPTTSTPSPPGGHDPPPSLFSPPPSSSSSSLSSLV